MEEAPFSLDGQKVSSGKRDFPNLRWAFLYDATVLLKNIINSPYLCGFLLKFFVVFLKIPDFLLHHFDVEGFHLDWAGHVGGLDEVGRVGVEKLGLDIELMLELGDQIVGLCLVSFKTINFVVKPVILNMAFMNTFSFFTSRVGFFMMCP